MLNKIKKDLELLEKSYPGWMEQKPESNEEGWRTDYLRLITDICAAIREDKLNKVDALELFDPKVRAGAEQLIYAALRPYYAFKKIQGLEKEHLPQIKYMLDTMWEQYVIRFNPELKIEPVGDLTEAEIREIECTLEALAFSCVRKTFSYEGILGMLKYQISVCDELLEHIAKRIDRDYRELQFNFLISKLDELSDDD